MQPEYHSWKLSLIMIQVQIFNSYIKHKYLTLARNTDATKLFSKKLTIALQQIYLGSQPECHSWKSSYMIFRIQTFNINMKLTISLQKIYSGAQPECHSWKSFYMIFRIQILISNIKRWYLTFAPITNVWTYNQYLPSTLLINANTIH